MVCMLYGDKSLTTCYTADDISSYSTELSWQWMHGELEIMEESGSGLL